MEPVFLVFSIIAIASMTVGNLLALLQNNVKRILAYSSIAHLGYVLVAFLAGGARAAEAVTFYLVAYFITTLGAFGVVSVLSNGERDADSIEDYRGLFWRRPLLAGVFTLMLLSLAGIPLTAGFVAKFFLVAAGASSALWAFGLHLDRHQRHRRLLLPAHSCCPLQCRASRGRGCSRGTSRPFSQRELCPWGVVAPFGLDRGLSVAHP